MEQRFETFSALIISISRSIRRIKTEEMEVFNLRCRDVSCLYFLYKESGLTASELCERCEMDKANLSRCIENLEQGGYIVCRSPEQRRYRRPLELTEQGQEVGRQVAEQIDRVLQKASEGLREEDRQVLYNCLQRIDDNLQSICEQYTHKEGDTE